MAENVLKIELREDNGKGVARKLRATGLIPGICYGRGEASQAITLDPLALERLIMTSAAGMNTLFDLEGGGSLNGKRVLVKELQRDPASGNALHADLYAIDRKQTIHVSVPIHLTGSAAGVKMGGILDHALRELELSCLPDSIPEEIPVDVTSLELGDSLHVSDPVLPTGVTLLSDSELSVVSLVAPAAEEEVAATEEEVTEEDAAAEGEKAEDADAPSDDKGADS